MSCSLRPGLTRGGVHLASWRQSPREAGRLRGADHASARPSGCLCCVSAGLHSVLLVDDSQPDTAPRALPAALTPTSRALFFPDPPLRTAGGYVEEIGVLPQ